MNCLLKGVDDIDAEELYMKESEEEYEGIYYQEKGYELSKC